MRRLRRTLWAAALLTAVALAWRWVTHIPAVDLAAGLDERSHAVTPARGEYLFRLAGCEGCHTDRANDGATLGGGGALVTPFGTFYAGNITPDPESGIGAWTEEDFVRALRFGVAPDGSRYYPAFPYPSYTGMSDTDLRALYAYLSQVPPATQSARPHELPWYLPRLLIRGWQQLFFDAAQFRPRPDQSDAWNRGAYLVTAVGHCGECHTPRNALGAPRTGQFLAGNQHGPEGESVPNITQSREFGIGKWSSSALRYFLEDGMLPDGDFTGSLMAEVIDTSLEYLTDADRRAIVEFLRTVPAVDTPP